MLVGEVWLLRARVPQVNELLSKVPDVSIPVMDLPIPLGTIGLAVILAVISRAFKLHDRLSDALGIRHRFDVYRILLPLALLSGADVSEDAIQKIHSQRRRLMRKTFYAYTSSMSDEPAIDRHYITMALDQWSWYWVFLECGFFTLVLGGVLAIFREWAFACLALAVVLGTMLILWRFENQTTKYALDQVEAIVADPARREEVRRNFNAL